MAKNDPAFLFYPGSWLKGTQLMTRSHKGAYMDLLMAQFSNGHLSLDDIMGVLGSDYESMWESRLSKCFVVDDNSLYYNEKLQSVMEERSRYKKGRLANLKGRNTTHKDKTHGVPYEKPICLNENINENKDTIINVSFKSFWDLYDKKVSAGKCEPKWNKLKDSDRTAIMEYIPKYKKAQPDKQYRKNPEVFLNNKSWNDEIITKKDTAPAAGKYKVNF